MLLQILNNPDKDWASVAFDSDAQERIRQRLKTAKVWGILTLFLWIAMMAAAAHYVASEILTTERVEKAQMIGVMRLSIFFFGLSLLAAAETMNRLSSSNTELRVLAALEGMGANVKSNTSNSGN
jgi:hypothetical protein